MLFLLSRLRSCSRSADIGYRAPAHTHTRAHTRPAVPLAPPFSGDGVCTREIRYSLSVSAALSIYPHCLIVYIWPSLSHSRGISSAAERKNIRIHFTCSWLVLVGYCSAADGSGNRLHPRIAELFIFAPRWTGIDWEPVEMTSRIELAPREFLNCFPLDRKKQRIKKRFEHISFGIRDCSAHVLADSFVRADDSMQSNGETLLSRHLSMNK